LIDGQPLTSGAVRFTPDGGRPATGEIGTDGKFALSTFDPGDGCPIGTHRVSIIAFKQISNTTRQWNAPKKYVSPESSGLTQTIEGPNDTVKIDLTWGSEKGPILEKVFGD
jgi:hypothetical protein